MSDRETTSEKEFIDAIAWYIKVNVTSISRREALSVAKETFKNLGAEYGDESYSWNISDAHSLAAEELSYWAE